MRYMPVLFLLGLLAACQRQTPSVAPVAAPTSTSSVAFVNANLWDGTGAAIRSGATLLVIDGRVASVSNDRPPSGVNIVDLEGAYVIPGLINTHGHVTANWPDPGSMGREQQVRDGLELYARYGVTTVLSLGGAPDEAFALRDAQDPANPEFSRVYLAGPVVADQSAIAARDRAAANLELGVDWLKLRVDDNLGRGEKMPWEAVQAVIDTGDAAGLPVATHIFYYDDAMRLLDMGTGMIAHSVRDADVDGSFMRSLDASGVCYVPTLTREVSTFVYADRPEFLDDPFFSRHANAEQVARVSNPEFQRNMAESEIAAGYRQALAQAMDNLGLLSEAGARIGFGTDSGPPARFPGYFEHLELEMMVDAGMSPEAALLSATGQAAACIGLDDIGTLEPGNWADFLVLTSDPTADIMATRTLERVYLAGREFSE